MNEKRMKAEYIKPDTQTVEIELENGAIICASGDSLFGNPGIDDRDYEED